MNTNPSSKTHNNHRSVEQWQDIMSAYDSSGLTQELFCVQESIALSTFYTWRKRLSTAKPAKVKSKKPLFVELTPSLPKQKICHWDIELSLGDSIVLRLRQSN